MKKIIYHILYKLLLKLVEPNEKINDEEMEKWLAKNYEQPGFKSYLTYRYSLLTRTLTSSYQGDKVYLAVLSKLMELREMERHAKESYTNKFVKEKKDA